MYESEVNDSVESGSEIPQEVIRNFNATQSEINERSLLPWTEHCIECAWPTCYSSCSLYEPRKDGKCQRFENGMVRIPIDNGAYLLKITFKKWGKLLATGGHRLYSSVGASRIESRDIVIGKIIVNLPLPPTLKKRVIQKRYGIKNRRTDHIEPNLLFTPDTFVFEVYNPHSSEIKGTLTFRSTDPSIKMPHQELTTFAPGYNRFELPGNDIQIDLNKPYKVEWTPNNINSGDTLYFGLMDFVNREAQDKGQTKEKAIKCIIWDLDNTIWNGTLIEDGLEGITLRKGIVDVIKKLDEGGILQSVASKNNPDQAEEAMKKFGIEEYFLNPQINWGPKSQSVGSIISSLNIGMDTVLFVDDQVFEREEVASAHQQIRTLDINSLDELQDLLDHVELKDTKEARNRRNMYRQEILRKASSEKFDGDYFDFLRSCSIKMFIDPVQPSNFQRVHELIQRTNQMNFSGNRYSEEEIRAIADNDRFTKYVISVSDKFGDYGIVGFGIFDNEDFLLRDLTFSCRIQSKRVEHAFLQWLLSAIKDKHGQYPEVTYHKTDRNQASGRVFQDLGFVEVPNSPDRLMLPSGAHLNDDGIIEITDRL